MTLQPLWTGSELLHKLLADYLDGAIDTSLFGSNFEDAFNFDVNSSALIPIERKVFQQLFNEVVFFSPLPAELAEIPNYRSEQQIRQAALAAKAELGEGT